MSADAYPSGIYQRFAGFEKLTGRFGYWPGFEDAEILSLHLARQGREAADGPVVTMRLRAFEWGHDAESGSTVINHRCVVTLRFKDVDELHLAGLDAQNPIFQLRLGEENSAWSGRLTVHFPAARGLSGSFSCAGAEVVAVRPGEPVDGDYLDGDAR